MVKDRDLDETGEALLAALAEHSPETPTPALRERWMACRRLRNRRPCSENSDRCRTTSRPIAS